LREKNVPAKRRFSSDRLASVGGSFDLIYNSKGKFGSEQ